MKNKMAGLLALTGSLWIFQGCYQDVEEEISISESQKFSLVEEGLRPYFQRFEDEAKKLGLQVDLTSAGIGGTIKDIEEENIAGRCYRHSSGFKEITFDKTYWERSSDLLKEFIVFHELGHCYLLRGHLEDAFDDGTCVSIMRSGKEDCRDAYNLTTREYYIGELFSPGEDAPTLVSANMEEEFLMN